MASWPWLKRWAVTKALLFPSSSWSCAAWQSLMAQEVDSSEGAAAPRPRLVVRSVAGEETMRLSASLRGRTHSLLRDKSEPVLKALKRVAIAAAKSEKNVKSKKRHAHTATDDGSTADAPIEAQLHVGSCSGPAVSGELPNSLAWVEDNVLLVGGVEYNIRVNPPTVLSLRLPDFVMSGCPIVPKVCPAPSLFATAPHSLASLWSVLARVLVSVEGPLSAESEAQRLLKRPAPAVTAAPLPPVPTGGAGVC